MRRAIAGLLLVLGAAGFATAAGAHCQVPCGIYTDEMRFGMIEEDITTIVRAMEQITVLGADDVPDLNQIVRWVTTKEEHAQKIQDVVSAYFLTQRIKPVKKGKEGYEDYQESLRLLHEMLVYAMKTKQTSGDEGSVKKLREATADFKKLYFKDQEHGHE